MDQLTAESKVCSVTMNVVKPRAIVRGTKGKWTRRHVVVPPPSRHRRAPVPPPLVRGNTPHVIFKAMQLAGAKIGPSFRNIRL